MEWLFITSLSAADKTAPYARLRIFNVLSANRPERIFTSLTGQNLPPPGAFWKVASVTLRFNLTQDSRWYYSNPPCLIAPETKYMRGDDTERLDALVWVRRWSGERRGGGPRNN